MGAIKARLRTSAICSAPKKREAAAASRLPADRTGTRVYSPKEFAAALTEETGIFFSERTIARRCCLPASHPGFIATSAAAPGRHWVLAAELVRLAQRKGAVA